jgi:hypothetical protein
MRLVDDEETALLRRARGAYGPDPEVAERVKAAVLAGALGVSLGGAGHATDVARRGLFSSWGFGQGLGGIVVKVLLGSVIALGVSAGTAALVFRNDAAHAPSPAETLVANPATTPKPEPHSDRAPESDPHVNGAASAAPQVVPDARTKTSRIRSGPYRAKAPPVSSLASELAAVRAAEAAVNGGNPNEALSILDASATSRPNLREEREALRTLAECARTPSARPEFARRFMTAFPASLYSPRVRAACAH